MSSNKHPHIRSEPQKKLHITGKNHFEKFHKKFSFKDVDVVQEDQIFLNNTPDSLNIFMISDEFVRKNKKNLIPILEKKTDNSLFYYIGDSGMTQNLDKYIDVVIPEPAAAANVQKSVEIGFQMLKSRYETENLRTELHDKNRQIQELSHIGQQLMMEKDLPTLLNLILLKSRQIAIADAGSLYLVEKNEKGEKHLRFMITQNDSISFDFKEFIIPISRKSISGYVADTGKMLNLEDVYFLPKGKEYSFNKSFDEKIGYRTKSMLVIPLLNHLDEITGVIQLINRKYKWETRLTKPEDCEEEVGPFTAELIEMLTALAGQAAVSIENNFLYQSIERLFEGFVNASVTAIESRDPTTSGHSSRVAILTERLAKTVDKVKTGFLANISFTKEQLKEIRYASLLHDFGKVGVRENVLLKAKKLYPHQSTEVLYRIGFLKKSEEIKNLRKQIRFLLDYGSSNYQLVFNELESELRNKLDDLDNISNLISNLNEPTVMETDKAESLEELAVLKFFDFDNEERNLLKPEEVKALSIKRGSLDDEERFEIESHVTHTFRFLKEVPWTKEFQNIPKIAHAHHEKLDGSGYPNKLTSESIPVQSKIMTISDIFDALTAADRPYKKAVPYERALDILQFEVNDNHIEPEILKVFIDAKVYTSVIKSG